MTETSLMPYFAVGLTSFLVGVVVGFVFARILAKYRKYQKQRAENRKLWKAQLHGFMGSHTHPAYLACDLGYRSLPFDRDKWEIKPKHLAVFDVIGQGEAGIVQRGVLNRAPSSQVSVAVAIKSLRSEPGSDKCKALLDELKAMAYLGQHHNIVGLIGAVLSTGHKNTKLTAPSIVVELCELGSVKDYLKKRKSEPELQSGSPALATTEYCQKPTNALPLVLWAYQISDALEFIHSKNLIHRDIAARNVLVFNEKLVKLADFGMAMPILEADTSVYLYDGIVAWKWCAIEALKTFRGPFTPESDVWAFAVFAWELFSLGEDPDDGVHDPHDLLRKLEAGTRLKQPKLATNEIYELMCKCWLADPDQRPSAAELKQQLESLTITMSRTTVTVDVE